MVGWIKGSATIHQVLAGQYNQWFIISSFLLLPPSVSRFLSLAPPVSPGPVELHLVPSYSSSLSRTLCQDWLLRLCYLQHTHSLTHSAWAMARLHVALLALLPIVLILTGECLIQGVWEDVCVSEEKGWSNEINVYSL